jgi:hypothetical protein
MPNRALKLELMKVVRLIGLTMIALTSCSRVQPPKPTRYILDSGATGWVKITYDRSDAPELPVEEGFAVVRVPLDLKISTRSRMNPSWEGSEFYYQSSDGKRARLSSKDDAQRRLWGLDKTSDKDGDRETFFVGEELQFTHAFKLGNGFGPGGAGPSLPVPATQADRMKILTDLPK